MRVFVLFFLVLLSFCCCAVAFGPVSCEELSSTDLFTEMSFQVDSRISGLTDSAGRMALFTTRGTSTGTWVKNPDVWTNLGGVPLDFSGQSVWNSVSSDGGYRRSGTLVSPRHIIFGQHYPIGVGETFAFIDSEGEIVLRTLLDVEYITGVDGSCDVAVGLLDSDVPSTVAFYPVLSEEQIVRYFADSNGVPIITLDQNDETIIRDVISFSHTCDTINGVC